MPKRILIVDDNEDSCRIFSQSLTREGYAVTLAKDGDEALRKIGWIQPDLILLDVMMPGVDGMRVSRTLKQNSSYKFIPILMVSARFDDPAFREQGLAAGAAETLRKPIDLSDLLANVRKHLNKTDQA